jgi:hypothetical protein
MAIGKPSTAETREGARRFFKIEKKSSRKKSQAPHLLLRFRFLS